jgi:DNA topoisomerase VI subunit B
MLRTFCSNPALGGFGGEVSSSINHTAAAPTPDAFCQIIKELVDNAMDACTVNATVTDGIAKSTKRVRVSIEKFEQGNKESTTEILRVTVTDNGHGMNDIQACVGAFHTSKAHNSGLVGANEAAAVTANEMASEKYTEQPTKRLSNEQETVKAVEEQTTGRYGIGLTLCLLHAQRLVPNSCASIQSALASDKKWKVAAAIVDTSSDAVKCFPRDSISKRSATESGTSVSILVPVSVP